MRSASNSEAFAPGVHGEMTKLRIGIHPNLKPHDGGVYQYSLTMLESLHVWSQSEAGAFSHEFVVFAHDGQHPALAKLTEPSWSIQTFRPPWSPEGSPSSKCLPDPSNPQSQPDMHRWLIECGIELMIYPSPHRLSFETDVPFIMSIHDLQHRLQPEFPEVSADGEFERREYLFLNATKTATLLIADSEVGCEDIIDCYDVDPAIVKPLPFLPKSHPSENVSVEGTDFVKMKYSLPEDFLFYPAQFWSHKNHVRLIEALGILKQQSDLRIPLVLSGSWSGTLREQVRADVISRAKEMGIENQLHLLGYVPDEDIKNLYMSAKSLVMPTFFGPTNIPVLEAWSHSCPVLCSDIRGISEQCGDAAVLVNPTDVKSIAEGIRRHWTDDKLRMNLIAKGLKRLASYTPKDYNTRLQAIIHDACANVQAKQLNNVSAL